jgi:alkylated DNA repair dioxygenase AlkB
VFSKLVQPNRYSAFYSDESQGYAFSGKKANSLPLTEELRCLLNLVNETYDENYNGILINKYVTTQDQHDYIGSHSDDERGLGKNGVLSISFGITRKFRIRDKKTKRIVLDIDLNHGDICIMKGFFQKEFTHEIPVEKKRLGTRWSLTFRHHSV